MRRSARYFEKFENHEPRISLRARWMIFSGIPIFVVVVLFMIGESLHLFKRFVSEEALPYLLYFSPFVIAIPVVVLYRHFPKHLVIPIGIVAWVVTAALTCWFFWLGPGAAH